MSSHRKKSQKNKKPRKELKLVESLCPEMKAVERLLKAIKKGEKPDIHDRIEASNKATKKWRSSEIKARERFAVAFSAAYFIYLLGEAREEYRERVMIDMTAHSIPIQKNSHFSMLVCKRYLDSDNSAASIQGQAMRGACLVGLDAETLRRNLKEGKCSMSNLAKHFRDFSKGHPHPRDPNYLHSGADEDNHSEPDEVSDAEAEVQPTLVWPDKYLDRWTHFANGQDISITVRKTGAFSAKVVTAHRRKPKA